MTRGYPPKSAIKKVSDGKETLTFGMRYKKMHEQSKVNMINTNSKLRQPSSFEGDSGIYEDRFVQEVVFAADGLPTLDDENILIYTN